MARSHDPDRFHRIVGWLFGIGLWVFVGLPVMAVISIGECLPRDTTETAACDTGHTLAVFLALFGFPLLAATVGCLMCRLSRFLG